MVLGVGGEGRAWPIPGLKTKTRVLRGGREYRFARGTGIMNIGATSIVAS